MTGDECLDVLTNPAADERAVKLAWEAYCMARYRYIPAAPDHWTDVKLLTRLLEKAEQKAKKTDDALRRLIKGNNTQEPAKWQKVAEYPRNSEIIDCGMVRFEIYTGFEAFPMKDGSICTWLASCCQFRHDGEGGVILAEDSIWSAGASDRENAKRLCALYAEHLCEELSAMFLANT